MTWSISAAARSRGATQERQQQEVGNGGRNEAHLDIPRDRDGNFEPVVVEQRLFTRKTGLAQADA